MKELKQIKNIKTGKVIKANYSESGYVPFQKCPICDGTGVISRPQGMPQDVTNWTSSAVTFTCDVCNGFKMIPMHKL